MKVSKSKNESIVYIDGEFLPERDAKISVFDHIVLYGDGVFDTCCAWGGKIFKLDQHIDRLFESAHAISIKIPLKKSELKNIILETLRKNELFEAYLKIIVSRGVGELPLLSPWNCSPSVIVFAKPYMRLVGDADHGSGIKVRTSSLRRVPPDCWDPKIKAINYLNHVLMRLEANQSGADDAIELSLDGYVAEAPGYNIFVAKKGIVYTPGENILCGITRETVFEILNKQGTRVIEAKLTPFDLYNADEVFFTSTAGGIYPVVEVDCRKVADGKPGIITIGIRDEYDRLLESGLQSISAYEDIKNNILK